MSGVNIKNLSLAIFAGIGSVLAEAFGGWDMFLKTLVMFMTIDYITGMAVAIIFHKSKKTKSGGASSEVGFRGIVKKVCMLLLIALAVRVDIISGTYYVRNATIFFFLGNEGLSILENVGLMGIEYPSFIKKALEIIKDKGEDKNE